MLPPNLEELILAVEDGFDDHKVWVHLGVTSVSDLRDRIKGVALCKKELFPSLRRFVVWMPFHDPKLKETPGFDLETARIRQALNDSSDFEKAGIKFSFYRLYRESPSFETWFNRI